MFLISFGRTIHQCSISTTLLFQQYYLADAKFAEMRRKEEEEGFYDNNRDDMTMSRNRPREIGLSNDKNMSSDSVFGDDEDENRQLVPQGYENMNSKEILSSQHNVLQSKPVETAKTDVLMKSELSTSIRSLRSNKVRNS